MKILGITIPTNGKYEDLIKLNYDEKKVKIKNIIQSWSKRNPFISFDCLMAIPRISAHKRNK
jgi:hypothetical protein